MIRLGKSSGIMTRDQVQSDAIDAILVDLVTSKSVLLQMPTQVGKTVTACKLIARWVAKGHRVIVLGHMSVIIKQFGDTLDAMGIPFLVEKGDIRAHEAMMRMPNIRVCLASKDSLHKNRIGRWPADFFDRGIVDECHLSPSESFQIPMRYFTNVRWVGLTATIDRLDGIPLSTVFEKTSCVYEIEDAIRNGHRCPFRVIECDIDIDIKGIKSNKKGELNAGMVEAKIMPLMNDIANIVKFHLDRLNINQFVAFLPDVAGAYAFAQILDDIGVSSKAVDGKNFQKEEIIESFKGGEFRGLINNKLLNMAFNHPGIEAVILLNPTTSRSAFDQMAGRCGATMEGKTYGNLFSFGWDTELSLMGPTDIFATRGESDRVKEGARTKARAQGADYDPSAVLKDAMVEVEREIAKEEERERKLEARRLKYKASKAEVRHAYREFDPIGVAVKAGAVPEATTEFATHEMPSKGYMEVARSYGIDPTGLSKQTLEATVNFWMKNEFSKGASPKMIAKLVDMKIPQERAMQMTAKEATSEFLRITKKGQYR